MAAAYVLFADQLNPNSTKQEIAQLSQKIAHPVAHKSAKASADINYQAMDRDYLAGLAGHAGLAAFVRDEVSAANQEWFGNLARGFNEYMQGDVNWDGDEDGEFEDGSRVPARDDKEGSNSSSKRNPNKASVFNKKNNSSVILPLIPPVRHSLGEGGSDCGAIVSRDDRKSIPGTARFTYRPRTYYRPTELDLLPPDMPPLDERFLEGQGGEGATFPHFVFGDKTHAFVAGETGLWQAQVKVAAAAEGAATPGATNQVVLTQHDKITLNGAASQDTPLIEPISHLTLYGHKKRPAVVVGDADPKALDNSIKIFAAVDDDATSFVNNDILQAEGKFYDAAEVHLEINQSIVGLTAARTKDRFFVAVADGGTVDRTLYNRPDAWDTETVRKALIDGMKKTDVMNNPKDTTLATVNPETTPITAKNTAYVQAVTTSIGNTVFLSGIDADPALYAERAFRDAINLRKGGLIDLAVAAAGAAHKAPDTLKEMADAATIIEEQTKADSAKSPVKTADLGNEEAKTLAAAIQVGLGWGINQLAASIKDGKETLAAADDTKPFASLNSIRDKIKSDMSIYVADQDGGSRGVCVADLTGNKITTKNGAGDFIVNPGKIITKAMYEGIDFAEADALAPGFGKLEEIGIPCAAYSAADAYPATQAIINGNIDMVYDDQLQSLFVGFEDISLGDNAGSLTNGSGAVCSVMVGQEKVINAKPSLYFQPIIANFGPLLFQENLEPTVDTKLANPTDFIAGFHQKHDPAKLAIALPADDLHASAKKLRVMHTSTGKDYLLFNGGVATKASFDNLGSKVYALPLVGPYDLKSNDVSAAGQIAKATRHAGLDFYKQGLKSIDFLNPVGDIGDLVAETGIVDTTVDYYSLSDLHTKTKGFVKAILTVFKTKGAVESQALLAELEKENHGDIQAGLASLALQSCYGSNTAQTPADTNAAATVAFSLVTGAYDQADPKNIQQSNLLEKIEQVGIDLAVAAGAADRAKTQAPAYDIARYVNSFNLQLAAADARADEAGVLTEAVLSDGAALASVPNDGKYAAKFGAGGDIKIKEGKVGAADAGGIAAGVAAVEGTLGWAIKNIYTGGNPLNTKKLIPAIQTMHTDAAFPAFDYVRVGCDAKRLSYDTSARVQDVQVVGDTVYVSLGGNRDAGHNDEAGVFASTAIFNEAGFVRSWSPWRRVLGQNNPVGSVALDAQTSRYWYTANKEDGPITTDKKPDAVRVTSWGGGFNKSDSSDARLSTALDGVFGDIGGIFGLYSFGPDTPGFKPRDPSSGTAANRHEQFSMTVATGNGRVALIKTGAFDKKDGIFVPTAHAAGGYIKHDGPTPGANIFVFDAAISAANNDNAGTALANLGLITCAEVSRLPLADSPNDSRGWLFVGGSGGLAVLTRWNTGRGWNTGTGQGLADLLPGTQRDDFPAGAGWRFMQILVSDANEPNPFKDVRKLVSDGSRYLYVMTAKAIWRIDMAAVPLNNRAPFIGGIKLGRTMQRYGIFQRKEFVPPNVAPANNEYTVVLNGDNLAHKVADMDAAINGGGAVFADKEAGQFLDMMVGYHKATSPAIGAGGVGVVAEADAKTQLIIGTTNGLFYNEQAKQFADLKAGVAAVDSWTQLKAAGGTADPVDDPIKGPVMRLEFTSSQVGDKLKKPLEQTDPTKKTQYYADGNLHVTAFSADKTALAVYRFNLSAADWQNPDQVAITPFVEPYNISGDNKKTTPYFYKVGTLNPGDEKKIEFGGPLDYFTRTAHVTGSTDGFADGVWMTPQLSDFERDEATGHFEDIDLGYDLTLPLYLGNIQIEPASGAQMVTGEFGLRVND